MGFAQEMRREKRHLTRHLFGEVTRQGVSSRYTHDTSRTWPRYLRSCGLQRKTAADYPQSTSLSPTVGGERQLRAATHLPSRTGTRRRARCGGVTLITVRSTPT